MAATPQTPKCHHNLGYAWVVVTFGSLWCRSHDLKLGINSYNIFDLHMAFSNIPLVITMWTHCAPVPGILDGYLGPELRQQGRVRPGTAIKLWITLPENWKQLGKSSSNLLINFSIGDISYFVKEYVTPFELFSWFIMITIIFTIDRCHISSNTNNQICTWCLTEKQWFDRK